MIGQQISLQHLIPRAITALQANPLAEADLYPGALLHAVLGADKAYWHANVEQWQDVEAIGSRLVAAVEELRDSIEAFRTNTF